MSASFERRFCPSMPQDGATEFNPAGSRCFASPTETTAGAAGEVLAVPAGVGSLAKGYGRVVLTP